MKKNVKNKFVIASVITFVSFVAIFASIWGIANQHTKPEVTPKEKFLYTQVGESIVIDAYNSEDKIVVIPESIDGIPVTQIGPEAFKGAHIKEVIFPENFESINYKAFQNCADLEKITLSPTISFLGAYAFEGCESLEEITLPQKLTSINMSTFENCTSLKKVSFSQNVNIIFENAFSNTALKNIKLPNNLKEIRPGAFTKCSQLKSVDIPNFLTVLSPNTFNYESVKFKIDNNEFIKEFINKQK